jgi:hypothetical protein
MGRRVGEGERQMGQRARSGERSEGVSGMKGERSMNGRQGMTRRDFEESRGEGARIERIVDWNALSEDLQLLLSREALRRAVETVAGQAELLAAEMEEGRLADLGGAEALRLLAAVARATGESALGGAVAGHA